MELEFGFVHAAVNVFCMTCAMIVYWKINDDIGSEREIYYFKRLLIAYMFFTASEAVWAIGNFGVAEIPVFILSLMTTTTMISVAFVAMYWLLYGEMKMGFPVLDNPALRIAILIPLALIVVLYVVSMFNGIMFSYNEEGMFVQGPLYNVTVVIDLIYLFFVSMHALVFAVREKSSTRQRELIALFMFIVPPAVAGVLDLIVPSTPLMSLAVFASILLVFANVQEAQIFNDALTGLNNRRRAEVYLDEIIEEVDADHPFYLFIVDADDFKGINDTHGHTEGDRALVTMARALRDVGSSCNGFVARYGGDEFLVLVDEDNISSPETIVQEIERRMQDVVRDTDLSYDLQATVGWARCDNPAMNKKVLLRAADAMLYERKQARRMRVNTLANAS